MLNCNLRSARPLASLFGGGARSRLHARACSSCSAPPAGTQLWGERELARLTQELSHHDALYYNDGAAALSDDAYDAVGVATVDATTLDDDDPTPLGAVSLSAVPGCSSATISWVPGTTDDLQAFALWFKTPTGAWSAHSAHLPADRSFSIGGLIAGEYQFQIQAQYADGSIKNSNVGEVTVSGCPIPDPPPPVTTTPAARRCA